MFLNNLATTLVFPLPADPDTRVWFLKYISLLLPYNVCTYDFYLAQNES